MSKEAESNSESTRFGWPQLIIVASIFYLLSSGPVLAMGFWLREATGYDGFYIVMWLYAPILMLGHSNPLMDYIEWWVVDVFGTVGPG